MELRTGTYSDGPWLGWVEPADRSWIVFVARDGKALFFGQRDETGAVVE